MHSLNFHMQNTIFLLFSNGKTASSVLIALVRQGPFQAWSPQVVPLVVLLVFVLQSWFLYLDQKTSSLAEMNRRWLFVTMIVAPDVYYQKTSSSFHGMHSFAIFLGTHLTLTALFFKDILWATTRTEEHISSSPYLHCRAFQKHFKLFKSKHFDCRQSSSWTWMVASCKCRVFIAFQQNQALLSTTSGSSIRLLHGKGQHPHHTHTA